ncbi:MAG: hypothetical protein ACREPM_13295, partial [Gemmatimonadaceae bacterium]
SNSDLASREIAGALSLDGDAVSTTVRGSAELLDRGVAGSIVQPSTTGREGQRRQNAGLDASWRNGMVAWTFTSDLAHERATYVDPSPPFGSSYYDTVSATGLNASSVASAGDDRSSASLGGDVRTTDVASTVLTASAPHWQRVLGAFGRARASRSLGEMRIDVDAAARADQSSLVRGTTLSPRIAASVSHGILAASASAGAGYMPPSLADQFFHEGVLVRPNPSLQPERTRRDVEARFSVRDAHAGAARLSAEAAAFRADVDGMILWLPDFRFVWSPSNNTVRRSGWELSGRGDFPAGFHIYGTVDRADVVYAGPVLAGQVAYRPSTTANVAAGAGPRYARVEITDQYVGARRTVPGSALNALDPYWLASARLSSSWSGRSWSADATLGIENLLNQPAAMLVDYPFPSRGWSLGLRLRRSPGGRAP